MSCGFTPESQGNQLVAVRILSPYLPVGKVTTWEEMKDHYLLNQARLPARLNVEQAAVVLGFQGHDIPVLVRCKLLKPLGNPMPNAPKYFSAAEVEKHARDPGWLDRATKCLSQHWHKKNQNRRSPRHGGKNSQTKADAGTQFTT